MQKRPHFQSLRAGYKTKDQQKFKEPSNDDIEVCFLKSLF